MSTEAPAIAPPVVAVVITCDAGPWLEETLAALHRQDYPNLSVLVVDAGSREDPTPQVAAVLPTAFVRRLDANPGFAAAANEALRVVEGASHFLFCHDDVAPDPDALRMLVEEAFRSNAGIVAPKLVAWDAPNRLLQVGMGADKSGAPALLVEPGELDQEQHDAVRDVFVAPSGCTLVRADLFATLGGFDEVMHLYGEDLDLSWRAQIAGARVVVAPGARVRHLEALSSGRRGGAGGGRRNLEELRAEVRPLQLRHRLRAVLKNYGTFHLVRVVPQIALLAVAEMLYGLAAGRVGTTKAIAAAWRWNLANRKDLLAARRQVKHIRVLPDGEVRRLQARGSARMTAFVRGQLAVDGRRRIRYSWRARRSRPVAPDVAVATGEDFLRLRLAVLGSLTLVLLLGSRHLLTGSVAAVDDLAAFPSNPFTLLHHFVVGWRSSGLGSEAPAPPAFALLGMAGSALLGAMGLLRTVLTLGCLPVGMVGAFRLAAPLRSTPARLAALVVYAVVPLPYDALAQGRWAGLLAYAAFPWVLARLARSTGREPFGTAPPKAPAGTVGVRGAALRREALPLGLLLAVLAAFVPSAVLVVLLVAAALAVPRTLAVAATAAALAAALLFPWSLDFLLPGSEWSAFAGVELPAARGLSWGTLLRFETGPLGAPPLGWAFLVAPALSLLIGRGRRLDWAARCWTVALVCWGAAWMGGRGWAPVALPAAEVLLAPAAAALALATALGVVAFQRDLPRYRFGWRQAASAAATTAVLLGAVPVLGAALDGRWHLPRQDFDGLFSWMGEERAAGAFRVLWLGDPDALPLPGRQLTTGLAYDTSEDGPPDVTAFWPPASSGATGLLADAVEIALDGETTKLGGLLAPAAVRYVVVPLRAAPSRSGAPPLPPPRGLVAALDAQVDLRQLESDEAVRVYENAAWFPGRVRQASGGASEPVLDRRRSAFRFQGALPAGSEVYLAAAGSPRWVLEVDGRRAPRRDAFGWANAWTVADGGGAILRYRTSPLRWAAVLIEVLLWAAVVRAVWRRRRVGLRSGGGNPGSSPDSPHQNKVVPA